MESQFNNNYGAGTYAYRRIAPGKNIEYALEHLSNDVVGEVTATRSTSGGRILRPATVNGGSKVEKLNAVVDSAGAVTFTNQASSPAAGFTLQQDPYLSVIFSTSWEPWYWTSHGTKRRRCKPVDGLYYLKANFLNNGDAGTHAVAGQSINSVVVAPDSLPIIDNGFKYRISFDENSGDLPDLVCNTDGLRSVYRLANAAYVSRDEPDRVHFVKTTAGSAQPAFEPLKESDLRHPAALTAGDTIYVGEQRCDIVSTDSDLTAGLALETATAENIHTASVVTAALKENSLNF